MATIARRHGFADVLAIWNHPNNKSLRDRRRSPNVLFPGDIVYIPDLKTNPVSCATGSSHRFQVKLAMRGVHVVFVDALGEPITNSPYVLRVEADERRGVTDGDGAVEEKGFHPGLDEAQLEMTDLGITRTLLIGHLDPHHEDSGWRQRLGNLGYERNAEGLAEFARDEELPEDTEEEKVRQRLHERSKS